MAAYTDDPLLQLASAYRYVKRSRGTVHIMSGMTAVMPRSI